jgi:O-antigen/teichoic acid export membrane protein
MTGLESSPPGAPAGEASSATARVGRGTAVTLISWFGSRALTVVTLIVLTQALSPTGLGAVMTALASGVLCAALAIGGLADATTRHAASATDEPFGRGDVQRSLVRFTATLPVIAALLVLIALSSESLEASLVVASLLLAVTQGATTIVASIFRARGQAGRFAFVTTVFTSVGRAVVAVGALASGAGAGAVLWAFVALNVALIAVTWRAAMRGLPATRSHVEGAGVIHLSGVVWSLMGNLDVVVVGVLLGAADAGMYGTALRLAEFSFQFVIALSVLYLPEATKLAVGGRMAAVGALYRRTSRWSMLVVVLTAGVGFVTAPALAEIVFPDDASTTATLMRILFVGYAVHGCLGDTHSTLVAIAAYADIRRWSLVALPTIVLGTIALTWAFDTVGAAAATCGAYVSSALWWSVIIRRRIGVRPFDGLYLRALSAVLAGCAAAALAFRLTSGAGPVLSLGVSGLIAAACSLALLPVLGGVTHGERRAISGLRQRLPERPPR